MFLIQPLQSCHYFSPGSDYIGELLNAFQAEPRALQTYFQGPMQVEHFLHDFLHFDGMENKTRYFDVNHLV